MIEERKMAPMQKCLQIPVQRFMQKGAEAECFAVREKACYRCRQQHWRVAELYADLYAEHRAVLRADGCAEKIAPMQKAVQILLQKRLQEFVQNGGTKRWQGAAMLPFVPIRLGKIQNCTDAERFAETVQMRVQSFVQSAVQNLMQKSVQIDLQMAAQKRMQPRRGDLSIESAGQAFPVTPAERPVKQPGTGRSAGATAIGGCP